MFMKFDKLKINYELTLSKIEKNGLQTHPPSWLRNTKIHINDTSPWLRDNKIMAHTHTTMTPNGRVMKIWRFLIYSYIHEFWQIKY